MIKQYFIQAIGQLKQHPLISAISLIGTALAIFLIMLMVMINSINKLPFSPESNRDRFLHATFMTLAQPGWKPGDMNTSNGPMSIKTIDELFKSLKTPEVVTAYATAPQTMLVSIAGQTPINVEMRETDAEYFKVFDYKFVDGKPYTKEDVEAHLPKAVITVSTARSLFGTTEDVVGKQILFNYSPCTVAGIVKDVSSLSDKGFSHVWLPYGTITPAATSSWANGIMGSFSTTILAKSSKDFPKIRAEFERRLAEFNKSISSVGSKVVPLGRPYTQEAEAAMYSSNNEPDVNKARRTEWTVYFILLLVPAINLASMTHSRLRQRVIEIGVRRAFGSTKTQLLNQIIMENLIITLGAGLVGFIMSLVFAETMSTEFFLARWSTASVEVTVDFTMLFKPQIFALALLFCFLLNLLSCGIPAWRASRSNIVNSLSGKIQ